MAGLFNFFRGPLSVQANRLFSRVLGSSTVRVLVGSSVIYNFSDPEPPQLANPIQLPHLEKLSPDFLIRQASGLSADQANAIATIVVLTLEEAVKDLMNCMSELSNLYEASVATGFALTDEGHHRIVELQEQIRSCKKEVSDLEILFYYVKKLLEANAEVAFATGAEFVSTQHVTKLLDEVRSLDRALVGIQQKHIEAIGKYFKKDEEADEN